MDQSVLSLEVRGGCVGLHATAASRSEFRVHYLLTHSPTLRAGKHGGGQFASSDLLGSVCLGVCSSVLFVFRALGAGWYVTVSTMRVLMFRATISAPKAG